MLSRSYVALALLIPGDRESSRRYSAESEAHPGRSKFGYHDLRFTSQLKPSPRATLTPGSWIKHS